MKSLRVKGILAFLAVVGLIFSFWYVVVDSAIESLIEKGGTDMIGAKVDLDHADLSILPLGLTLKGLDMTDPDAPMTNMLHVDRMAFLMDFKALLMGKVIVNEMAVDGVMVNTPRKSSGAIPEKRAKASRQKEKVEKEKKAFSFPALDVPNAEEILEKEKLETLIKVDEVSNSLRTKKAEWDKKIKELPDSGRIKEYEKRIRIIKKRLKGSLPEALKGVKEAKELQDDINGDLKRFKDARKALRHDVRNLKGDIKRLKKLPGQDLERLKNKYSLSSAGVSNFSRLLFGGKIAEWTSRFINWNKKLAPYMEQGAVSEKEEKPPRAKGLDVKFREFNPRPDFLVKTASLSARIKAGDIKGEIKNITDNQSLIGVPATFILSGDKLKGIGSLKIDGEVKRLDPAHPEENILLKVKDYRIKGLTLLEGGDFPVTMEKSSADINVRFTRKKENFYGDFDAMYGDVLFATDLGKKSPPLAKALASALSGVKRFNIKGTISGDREGHDIKLSSNLDRIMKKAVGDMVKKESARFAKELNTAIMEKIKGPMKKLGLQVGDLGNLEEGLSGRLKELEGQLKISDKLKPKGLSIKL